jgi:hypothetical protein
VGQSRAVRRAYGGRRDHTSLSAVEEDNFWGKFALSEPSRHRLPSVLSSGLAWWNKYRIAAASIAYS